MSEATISKYGSVNGTVYDEVLLTGNKVSEATVKVFKEDGTPYMHTITDLNGNYTISELPIGIYKIAAVKDGYLLSNMINITITDILPITMDLLIQKEKNSNLIYGKIKDINNNEFISNVNVLLYKTQDGEKKLVSSSTSIEDGEYELAFEKKGYQTSTINKIVLSDNIKFKADITLENVVGNINSTVSGIIKDSFGKIVVNAFVGLYKIEKDSETLVATTYTNIEGKYMFGNVTEGNYKVKAKLTSGV